MVTVQRYLTEVGTEGTGVQDAITLAGITPVHPFAEVLPIGGRALSADSGGGTGKQWIDELYRRHYPTRHIRPKRPLHGAYNEWLRGYRPGRHPSIRDDLEPKRLQGKRNALVFAVERYLVLKEANWDISRIPPPDFTRRTRRSKVALSVEEVARKAGRRVRRGAGRIRHLLTAQPL